MKSQLVPMLQIARGVLSDVQSAYASYSGMEKDYLRLVVGSETRGLAFFTLDLPQLDDVLTGSLRCGVLEAQGPLSRHKSRDDRRPRFLWDLWSKVFEPDGSLKQKADPNAILFLRQIFCLGKKIDVPCSPARLMKAVKEYHEIESAMVGPVLNWGLDQLSAHTPAELTFTSSFGFCSRGRAADLLGLAVPPREDLRVLLQSLDMVSRELANALGLFTVFDAANEGIRFRHGPGAVADAKTGAFKYQFPCWPLKLEGVFPYDYCGSHTIDVREAKYPSRAEPPSRLIAVPKTAKGPRLIASEPTSHQWCQQFLAGWLRQRMERSWIGRFVNIRDQSPSRSLAREASISGALATLDLSSASDRLSLRCVESLFRTNLSVLEALHAVRTRWIRDDISDPPVYRELKKFAAQGNGVTFPVQSLFFVACALAACQPKTIEDIRRLEGQVRVFGDDIVVPKAAYAGLCELLEAMGLKVNRQKSFADGHFRESCGLDAFEGYDVTPLKPRLVAPDGPSDHASMLDLANNLHVRGFWRAADVVVSTAAGFKDTPVVQLALGLPGLQSFSGSDYTRLRSRWNPRLCRDEVLVALVKSNVTRVAQDSEACLLQYFTEQPDPLLQWSSGSSLIRSTKLVKRWVDAGSLSV